MLWNSTDRFCKINVLQSICKPNFVIFLWVWMSTNKKQPSHLIIIGSYDYQNNFCNKYLVRNFLDEADWFIRLGFKDPLNPCLWRIFEYQNVSAILCQKYIWLLYVN